VHVLEQCGKQDGWQDSNSRVLKAVFMSLVGIV
jgi:hypothetical protein